MKPFLNTIILTAFCCLPFALQPFDAPRAPYTLLPEERAALESLAAWADHPLIAYLLDERPDLGGLHRDLAALCAPERETLRQMRLDPGTSMIAMASVQRDIKRKVPYFPEIVIEGPFIECWGSIDSCLTDCPVEPSVETVNFLARALISNALLHKRVAIQHCVVNGATEAALIFQVPLKLLPVHKKVVAAGEGVFLRAVFGSEQRLILRHRRGSPGLYRAGSGTCGQLYKYQIPDSLVEPLNGCQFLCPEQPQLPDVSCAVSKEKKSQLKLHLSDARHRERLTSCRVTADDIDACVAISRNFANANPDKIIKYLYLQDFSNPVISCLVPAIIDGGRPRCFIAFSAHGSSPVLCEPYTVYDPTMTFLMAAPQPTEQQAIFFKLYQNPAMPRAFAAALGEATAFTSTDAAASGGAASTEADQRLLMESFLQLIANALSLSVDEIALDCEGADASQRTHMARELKNFASKAQGKLPKAKFPEPSENISITKFNNLWKADPDTILRRIQGGRADSRHIDGLAAWMGKRRKRLNADAPQPRRGKRQAGVIDEPAAQVQDAVAAPQDPPQPGPQPDPGPEPDAQPAQDGWLRRMWNAARNADCAIQ